MEFKIDNVELMGLSSSKISASNSFKTTMLNCMNEPTDVDDRRAKHLGSKPSGSGEDNYLTGIIVNFDLYAPLYMWKQIQRYHFFQIVSSQSTMHCVKAFDIYKQVVEDTDPRVVEICEELKNNYLNDGSEENFRKLIASLPSGFVLGARVSTNYAQLKTIYKQRKGHKLREWSEFLGFCCELPEFLELTGVEPDELD